MEELKDMHRAFGKNLSAYRKSRGLTQKSLGERTGVSRTYISRVERGRGNPTFATVMRLAKTLDIDAGFLFFGIR